MTADADALYALDPEDFTAARDALARQLKADGDVTGSAAVKAMRRPTVAAWLLNLLAGERPEVVEEVTALAARLRSAQAAALSGRGGDALRSLVGERRDVVRRAVQAAAAIGADRGRDVGATQVDAMTGMVEAVLADEALAELWRAGRLTTTEQAAGFSFGDVDPSSVPVPAARKPAAARPEQSRVKRVQRAAKEDPGEQAARRLEALRDKASSARTAAEEASAEVARRRLVWQDADRLAKAARQALRDAERVAAKADLMAATAEQAVWEAGERARRD